MAANDKVGISWSRVKDVMSFLVIPIFLWGVKLEVGNARRDLLIRELESDIEDLRQGVAKAQDIDKGVQKNAIKLAVLEGKIDTANGRLNEIAVLLRQR